MQRSGCLIPIRIRDLLTAYVELSQSNPLLGFVVSLLGFCLSEILLLLSCSTIRNHVGNVCFTFLLGIHTVMDAVTNFRDIKGNNLNLLYLCCVVTVNRSKIKVTFVLRTGY